MNRRFEIRRLDTTPLHLSNAWWGWGRGLKAFSKSKMKGSACPLLSKILAQSCIMLSTEFHSYVFFRNACCLPDKSLCSSKCAIIFEQTICSSNMHDTQVTETSR